MPSRFARLSHAYLRNLALTPSHASARARSNAIMRELASEGIGYLFEPLGASCEACGAAEIYTHGLCRDCFPAYDRAMDARYRMEAGHGC